MTPAGTAGSRTNTNTSRARTPHTPHRHPTTAASRFLSSPDQMKCDSAQLPMVESVYLEILSKPPSWRPPACWVCRGECASNGQADPATRQYQQYCGACRDGLRARRVGHEKPPSHFRHSIAFFLVARRLAAALQKDTLRGSRGVLGACARVPTSTTRRACSRGLLLQFFWVSGVARPHGVHQKKNRRRRLFRICGGGRPSPGQRPPGPGRRTGVRHPPGRVCQK